MRTTRFLVVVERSGQTINLSVTPTMDSKEGVGTVGWVAEQDAWVAAVAAGSPAAAAGLRSGDVFVNEKGQTLPTGSVQQMILRSDGKPVELTVRRAGAIEKLRRGTGRHTVKRQRPGASASALAVRQFSLSS